MHDLIDCDTVPKMFGIGKLSVLNVLRKSPLNHLGNLNTLPEVIAEEANKFVAWCYGDKNSLNTAEIRFVYSTKFILWPLWKTGKTGWHVNLCWHVDLLIFWEKHQLDIVIPPHSSLLIFDLCFRKPTLHHLFIYEPLISLSTYMVTFEDLVHYIHDTYCIKWIQSPFAYFNPFFFQNFSRRKQMCKCINCISQDSWKIIICPWGLSLLD